MKLYIYLLFILLGVGELTAQTFEVDGINYNILNATDVEVIAKAGYYTGNITVPATVNYDSSTYDVTTVGYEAFRDCSNLTSVVLPNSLTIIREYGFRNCRKITSLTIPDSVLLIERSAFLYCTKLVSINIPENLTTINYGTFSQCYELMSITIPESVTSIATYAFSGCSSLSTVNIFVVSPIAISIHMFWNLDLSLITLNVPSGSESAYASASVWQDFGSISILSTDTVKFTKTLKVYPNPVINELKVSGLDQPESFKIHDVLGNVVIKSEILNKESINLEGVVPGLYFLIFNDKDVIKFIKN
ncbi:leucine-rich repeat domain-containing protein [Seonamhaeicola maritimus]|uniref:Leucine-rich repeat protein n=1 Tax=Seonamhaeicola maritimus TaxID=2591822 RepID=A0A5C7GN31_9FLAO|nr:leucine-rich repeat domain-containing protein [Seonamhaeicola maritimus]TXG39654.1 leucine-rich repeat protein [Seonamhaeicola maritimus]